MSIFKANPLHNLFSHVWKYSSGNHGKVILFIAMSVLGNCILLAEPVLIGRVFNSVQFSSHDPALLSHLVKNISMLLAVTLGFWAFHGTSRVLERKNAYQVRQQYKQELFGQVLDLPAPWHKDHHSGDTIDKINKASDGLFNFSGSIYSIVQSGVKLVGSLAILTFFDWKMSVIALMASLIAIGSMLKFDEALRKHYAKIFKSENHLASAIHDYISNITTIITLKLKPRVTKEIRLRSDAGFPIFKKSLVITELKWFWVNFLIALMVVGVLILYAYQSFTLRGVIVIGTLFTLYSYLKSVGDVFASFASRYGEFVQQDAAIRAVDDIKSQHKEIKEASELVLPTGWKSIEICDLLFSYEKKEGSQMKTYHLKDINLQLKKGQKIAFIGESGSGKSTTLGILRGLYKPKTAEMFCDGEKLPMGLAHLHNNVTLIPQEPELFNSTIEDNITMDTKVSQSELNEIIDLAQFRSVVDRLAKGLKTNVQEKGVSMSGGEKQRLALARGLLAAKVGGAKKSDFLFLDEPTSNVDASNELKIYENIFSAFRHKTIISTVHRLHLLKFFDYIYYFKGGTIAAEGTLEELYRHNDFQTLWSNYSRTFEVKIDAKMVKQPEFAA